LPAAGDDGGGGVPVVAVGVEDVLAGALSVVAAEDVSEPVCVSAAAVCGVAAAALAGLPSPPETITALDTVASTSIALIAISSRSWGRPEGKFGRRMPIAIETNSAQATSRPPAT